MYIISVVRLSIHSTLMPLVNERMAMIYFCLGEKISQICITLPRTSFIGFKYILLKFTCLLFLILLIATNKFKIIHNIILQF